MTFSSSSTPINNLNYQTNEPEQAAVSDKANNRIKKLPPLLVNQLAAGEVVTRPASVVKELIENAIDAGAKHIEVRITQGGMGIIEVSDDGCGIHPDDMIMAVTRFATSKIADVAHLQGIATLGFRGEALAATAAVSRLTLTSCSDDTGIGRELNVAGILEDTPQLIPVVHPRGTTVTVKDLYFNVPARRGNLKSISIEYAHIEMVVKQLALVASDVSFALWHNDKRRFNFESIGMVDTNLNYAVVNDLEPMKSAVMQSVLARLKAVIPNSHDQAELFSEHNLQPLTINLEVLRPQQAWENNVEQPLSITGFLIPSARVFSGSNYKLIYINGRLVKDRRIAQSVRDSASGLPNIENLGYVLFFNLPKLWLNLNVHPSKQSIKIQNLANIMAHLEVGVRDGLQIWQARQRESNKLNAHFDLLGAKVDEYNKAHYLTANNEHNSSSAYNSGVSQHIRVQQPTADYEIQNDNKCLSENEKNTDECIKNGLNIKNRLNQSGNIQSNNSALVTASVAFNDTHSATNKGLIDRVQPKNTSYFLKGLAILDKGDIDKFDVEAGELNKLKASKILDLVDINALVLIQYNQYIYLFSDKGLKLALHDLVIEPTQDTTTLLTASSIDKKDFRDLDSLSHLNALLDSLQYLPKLDSHLLLQNALTQISVLELATILVQRL
ncbi:DNA mismatch repair endonuclease MutL [Psychrobacter sp.]|uniref:DNA mismatch repair endonuclease MutL n=1 Tax=Psychrobacter sp. TaxID=56811 RepID=UPI0025CE6DA9|nr:DNA mismatch repair endonuclease MutL [Psychrobacter sp.]